MPADPHALLAVLADDARLRVFAHILLHGGTTASVADAAGLGQKETLRILSRLESVDLLAHGDAGWLARPEVLRRAAADAAARPEVMDHGVADPESAAVLRAFLPHGRLERIPAARGKRLVVLDHVARVFEPGIHYPEAEVNVLLQAFHPDYAALRRHLVDEGFLARAAGEYWRIGGSVSV